MDEDATRADGGRQGGENGGAGTRPGRGPIAFVRWTRELEGCFLDHVSATGNISAAARAIGVSLSAVYYRHRTNAAFAAAWEQALDAGYRTIEARMIEHMLTAETFDWDKALRMLTQRTAYLKGGVARGGRERQVATADETDAVILRRLAMIAARKAGRRARATTGEGA